MRSSPFLLSLVVVGVFLSTGAFGYTCSPAVTGRLNCGYYGINQQQCQAKGCCWSPIQNNPTNQPWCYFPTTTTTYSVVRNETAPAGYNLTLEIDGESSTSYSGEEHVYGKPVSELEVGVEFLSESTLHVKIFDPNVDRYEVPQSVISRPPAKSAAINRNYDISVESKPFRFLVTRRSDGAVLFNSTSNLQFFEQYLSMTTGIYGENPTLFGLEESTMPTGTRLDTNNYIYTMWNRDIPESNNNVNLYGSHPFYLQLANDGSAHGVLLLNSNGMDIIVNPTTIDYRVIGGVFDFYFFAGPTLGSVVSQYTAVVGLPHMPPAWSLGFHQSHYGYPNVWTLMEVVANYSKANIPLDTIWSDIDHMDAYRDFTFNPVNYPVPVMQEFVAQLHEDNQQYVVILDPGISINTSYSPYNDLIESKSYIQDCNGNALAGVVWPGPTIFTDFLSEGGQAYWGDQIETFLKLVPIDGLWIDMNEISNFESGVCPADATPEAKAATEAFFYLSSLNGNVTSPPYSINNGANGSPLNTGTISPQGIHHVGDKAYLEYDVHNMHGLTESIATKDALQTLYNKRAFVLTRSTFVSSGAHVSHWTGDNESSWPDLFNSIVKMITFGMLGVPHVGSDICGFNGDTTAELCARWIEVGAFYPFSRDHYCINTTPQELYRFPQTIVAGQAALGARYSLFPYYYTLSYLAHTTGEPIARGLFYNFAGDLNTHFIDEQFMIGPAFMVTPVLEEGATSVVGYFPAGTWYDFYNLTTVDGPQSGGRNLTLGAPLEYVPLHVYGGNILPMQDPELTIAATMANNINLLVALNSSGSASGSLFLDDGSTLIETASTFMTFVAESGVLSSTVQTTGYSSSLLLEDVTVLGLPASPKSVSVNGSKVQFTYNGGILAFTAGVSIMKPFTITY